MSCSTTSLSDLNHSYDLGATPENIFLACRLSKYPYFAHFPIASFCKITKLMYEQKTTCPGVITVFPPARIGSEINSWAPLMGKKCLRVQLSMQKNRISSISNLPILQKSRFHWDCYLDLPRLHNSSHSMFVSKTKNWRPQTLQEKKI